MKIRDIIHLSKSRGEWVKFFFFIVLEWKRNKKGDTLSSLSLSNYNLFLFSFVFLLWPYCHSVPPMVHVHSSRSFLSHSVPGYSGQLQVKMTKWRSLPCHRIKWNEMTHEKMPAWMLVCSCQCVCVFVFTYICMYCRVCAFVLLYFCVWRLPNTVHSVSVWLTRWGSQENMSPSFPHFHYCVHPHSR